MCHKWLRTTPGFWLLLGWFAAVNGWRPLAVVLSAAAIHELGHWVVLRLLGARLLSLRLGPLGAVMETDSGGLSYGRELAAVIAGPGANLLCALALSATGSGLEELVGAHLVLGMFNLLPIRPLDGGRSLCLVLSWLFGPSGEEAARWISAITALAAAGGLAFVIRGSSGNLWLLPAIAGAIAAAAGEMGLLSGKMGP